MGQNWNIICLDRHEALNYLDQLRNDAFILSFLTNGRLCNRCLLPLKLANNVSTKTLAPFEQLPCDILFCIFATLWSTNDILSLFLSCYRLLIVGDNFIQANIARLTAPWAGKRLICLGEYSCDSLPNGILTPAEIAQLDGRRLYDVCKWYPVPRQILNYFDFPQTIPRCWNLDSVYRESFGPYKVVYPSALEAVLRNKTLKVYVGECLFLHNTEWHFPLGSIVILQTFWSTDSEMPVRYQNNTQKHGPWAGHRFDITWIDEVDETWTDVTEEVVKNIWPYYKNIFQS